MSRTREHLILAELEQTYTETHIFHAYNRTRQIGCTYAVRNLYHEILNSLKDACHSAYHSFIESLKSKRRKNVRRCGFF